MIKGDIIEPFILVLKSVILFNGNHLAIYHNVRNSKGMNENQFWLEIWIHHEMDFS